MHEQDTLPQIHAGEKQKSKQLSTTLQQLHDAVKGHSRSRENITKSVTVHFVSPQGQIKTELFILFSQLLTSYMTSVKSKDTVATESPVFAVYDTVNNLHDKAHSWKVAQRKSHISL